MTETPIKARFKVRFATAQKLKFELDADLLLPGKGIIALFGHSGSGKTTLLRCMAGLQNNQQGQMIVDGEVWQNDTHSLATHKRQLAYVFQEASLLPHLNVENNLRYAIKRATPVPKQKFAEIITLMGLNKLLSQFPSELSGGEKQRVALARALITLPKLILMDEPLASLDITRKQEILPYLEIFKKTTQVPIIYVSHDINEVARLADYVVVLEQGKVIKQGTITNVLPQISQFSGLADDASCVFDAEVIAKDLQWHLIQVKLTSSQQSTLWLRDSGEKLGQTIRLRLLAKDVSITLENHQDSSIVNRLAATIVAILDDPDPSMALIEMHIEQRILLARITQRSVAQLQLKVRQHVWAQIKSVAIVV
jgi:molybdate transport system ATP-binding protein